MILPEKFAQKIKEIRSKLDSQGEIFSKSQLDKFSETFKQRFSPAKLNSIDGETLLDTMHNHSNSDSLVYWLEYKNDDELPSTSLGSIGGGSALKFGIYKRKETGAWMTGSPQNQKELSIDEAVEIARKQKRENDLRMKIAQLEMKRPYTKDELRLDHSVIGGMIAAGSRVLDMGCGDGDLLEYLVVLFPQNFLKVKILILSFPCWWI